MNKLLTTTFLFLFALTAKSQNPVALKYSAKKTGDKTYTVQVTATIQRGWHIYSQTQPADAIALPTEIKFNKNPLLVFKGKTKEQGVLEKHKEPTLGIEQWQYSHTVSFVQELQLKAPVNPSTKLRTNITGSITYQVCDEEKCLPPKTVSFSIPIQ